VVILITPHRYTTACFAVRAARTLAEAKAILAEWSPTWRDRHGPRDSTALLGQIGAANGSPGYHPVLA